MGQTLTRVLSETEGCVIAGGVDAEGSPYIVDDIGELAGLEHIGLSRNERRRSRYRGVRRHRRFHHSEGERRICSAWQRAQAPLAIIGTTGFDARQRKPQSLKPQNITAIVKAGNMSLGVNLLQALTRQAAAALGNGLRHRNC